MLKPSEALREYGTSVDYFVSVGTKEARKALAEVYYKMAELYFKMSEYNDALNFSNKAIQVEDSLKVRILYIFHLATAIVDILATFT